MRAVIRMLLVMFCGPAAASPAKPIGIVLEVSGPVFVTRMETGRSAVNYGDAVLPGDEISTGEAAWVIVSLPRAIERVKRLGANVVWRPPPDAREIPWVPAYTGKRRAATSRGDEVSITLQLPRTTRVAALPFRLSWRNAFPQLDTATLVVREPDGTIAAVLTGHQQIDVRASNGLSSGHIYCWDLQAPDGEAALASGSFRLLESDEIARVQLRLDAEAPRAEPGDEYSTLLIQFAVLVDEALYVDAAQRLVNSDLAKRNERLYERFLIELAALSSIRDPLCP